MAAILGPILKKLSPEILLSTLHRNFLVVRFSRDLPKDSQRCCWSRVLTIMKTLQSNK